MATDIFLGTSVDWEAAGNWSLGAAPVDTNDVIIENSSQSVTTNLDQPTIDANTLKIKANYTGSIGVTAAGTYLEMTSATTTIGEGDGNGSPLLMLNHGTVQTAVTVYKTGTATDSTLGALQWIGTNAANVVTVQRGHVGIAMRGGAVATVATLNVGYMSSQAGDSKVWCGSGTTLTTINQTGGELVLRSNAVTLNIYGGKTYLNDAMTVTTVNLYGGTLYYNSSGTATTINVMSGGVLDFSQRYAARTVTTCNAYKGAVINDPYKTVDFTANGINFQNCGPNDTVVNFGQHLTLTPSAI